jgi:hypothetical protein
MVATKRLSALVLLGAAALFGVPGLLAQSAQQPASHPVAARLPYSAFKEIHVDQDCHLLPNPALKSTADKKPHLRKDAVICHLETVNTSEHIEETIDGNEMRRNRVGIREQTYVLQNVTKQERWFVVEQLVPEGWVVDSDPQPAEMDGATAVFRVHAEPGEIVRLHVGVRHTKPLRTRQSSTTAG